MERFSDSEPIGDSVVEISPLRQLQETYFDFLVSVGLRPPPYRQRDPLRRWPVGKKLREGDGSPPVRAAASGVLLRCQSDLFRLAGHLSAQFFFDLGFPHLVAR